MDPETDAAIASIDAAPAPRGLELAAYGSQKIFQPPRAARLGDILEKSGRTTGVTRGRVTGIGFFGGLLEALYIAPLPGAQDRTLARRGDSGAIWYDPAGDEMVGLHLRGPFAPSPVNEFALASQMTKVFTNLELEIIP
jgi:endonuclease G